MGTTKFIVITAMEGRELNTRKYTPILFEI